MDDVGVADGKASAGDGIVSSQQQAQPPSLWDRGPMRAPHFHIDSFLKDDLAQAMRDAIDLHFLDPYKHGPEQQIWNYWHVPETYTYMRTDPHNIIPRALVDRFHAAIGQWAWNVLGMGHVTGSYLSLYVDGCEQILHNDSLNGRFGYVYSLTNDIRQTRGGETLVFKEGDPFRGSLTRTNAGEGLYDLIEPKFNRLAVFDDRMPHGVRRVEGSMDPRQCRLVMHGHISESGPTARGALPAAIVAEVVELAANTILDSADDGAEHLHGPLTMRILIAPDGSVAKAALMVDRVAGPTPGAGIGVGDRILDLVRAAEFPPAHGATEAIVPLAIGGLLPWMEKQLAAAGG